MFPPTTIEKQNREEAIRQYRERLYSRRKLIPGELADALVDLERINDPGYYPPEKALALCFQHATKLAQAVRWLQDELERARERGGKG